jgi:hypothetical protein
MTDILFGIGVTLRWGHIAAPHPGLPGEEHGILHIDNKEVL